MYKLLIVEDDKEIAAIEKDYLEKEGNSISIAANGTTALNLFQKEKFDLVILDLNIPEIDGITVCKKIRSVSKIPVIMVTARIKEIDELLGFNVGADDYLKKPFSPKILVARVNALLSKVSENKSIQIKNLLISPEDYSVKKGAQTIGLTQIQFNLLYTLASKPEKVFSRDELLDRGYSSNIPPDIFDRTIDSHIKNIRRALNDRNSSYIKTIRGIGYKFNND